MTGIADMGRPANSREQSVTRSRVALSCLAIISGTTAAIHFAVAGSHFQEYWAYGIFMLAAGWFQVLWTLAAVLWPSRPTLWTGALLNLGIVAAYIVTRTVGDVIGPGAHQPEQAGFGDVCCTILEAVVAAGCAWLLLPGRDRHMRRRVLIWASAVTGVAVVVLLSVSLVAGGPDMVSTGSAMP